AGVAAVARAPAELPLPVGEAPAIAAASVAAGEREPPQVSRAIAADEAAAPSADGVTIHAPITVSLTGSVTPEVREDLEAQFREHARVIGGLVEHEVERRDRRRH